MRASRLVIVGLFAVGIGSVVVSALLVRRVSSTVGEIQGLHSPALAAALRLQSVVAEAAQTSYAYLLTRDGRERKRCFAKLSAAQRALRRYVRTARADHPGEEQERALLGRISTLVTALGRDTHALHAGALSAASLPAPSQPAAPELSRYQRRVDATRAAVRALVAHEHQEVRQIDRMLLAALSEARLSIWGVAAAVLLLVVATGFSLRHALGRTEAALAEQRRMRDRFVEGSLRVQDDERRRIARELHDETGQSLAALAVGLRQIGEQDAPPEARETAARLQNVAENLVERIGRLVHGLHPQLIEDHGLVESLEQLADETRRAHDVELDLEVVGVSRETLEDAGRALALYRIAQEALTNAVRHGGAGRIDVCLVRRGDVLRLTIEDDGCGFDPGIGASHGGIGLHGMRERAAAIGATLAVESRPGTGTTVAVDLPLEHTNV